MADEVYRLGAWRAMRGKEREFVAALQAVGRFFNSLPRPPGRGTLSQSVDDPQQFYSFEGWCALDDIQAMRSHADTPMRSAS